MCAHALSVKTPAPPSLSTAQPAISAMAAESSARDAATGGWDAAGDWVAAPAAELGARSLVRVDLAGVSEGCVAVSVAGNLLRAVDLGPLRGLCRLESVVLNGNSLRHLDLGPLAGCPALQRLWLHNNELEGVDLGPLGACKELRSLYLDGNRIHRETVDLAPLAACRGLKSLRLGRNLLAGVLDITPVLACGALSCLDVSASVKLVARVKTEASSAHAAAAALPPALRRRAATVVWSSEGSSSGGSDEDDDDDDDEAFGDADFDAATLSRWLSGEQETVVAAAAAPVSGLAELGALQESRRPHGVYAALVVGFRGNNRFAVEALLSEHASLHVVAVSSRRDSEPDVLIAAGALVAAHVVLVRPEADALVTAFRARDPHIPIVVIGNCNVAADAGASCLRKGASCFLTEPLCRRDAITIRSLAQHRARAVGHHRRRSPSPSPLAACAPLCEVPGMDLKDVSRAASIESMRSGDGVAGKNEDEDEDEDEQDTMMLLSSPVTSSDSSPPTGVPTSAPRRRAPSSVATTSPSPKSLSSPVASVARRHTSAPWAAPPSRQPSLPRRPPRLVVDFDRLKQRVSCGNRVNTRSRVEDSALGMVFSRCNGRAEKSDFMSIATLCGLPVCMGPALYGAARNWMKSQRHSSTVKKGGVSSPVSVIVGSAPCADSDSEVAEERECGVEDDDCDSVRIPYESFQEFYTQHLRSHHCEARLFNVLRVAHGSERRVPVEAIRQLAMTLKERQGGEDLAAAILCYELKGTAWKWMGQRELARAKLCGALLAAESGIYNGVVFNLRSDRMEKMRAVFASACRDCTNSSALTVKDVVHLNMERGLLTPRAAEIVFARHVRAPSAGMTLCEFAPMWLATTEPSTAAACEYLFGIADADNSGYITSTSCMHLYTEKQELLERDGFIPIAPASLWLSMVDIVCNESSRVQQGARKQDTAKIALSQLRGTGARERTTFLQSLLFVDDGMASVDQRCTAESGSAEAKAALKNC